MVTAPFPSGSSVALLRQHRAAILALAEQHGAGNVRVFGSVVRGEERGGSDIDFLVRMQPGRSLLDMGGLLMDLQDLLGREVDLISEGGLHGPIGARIRAEARPLTSLA